MTTTTFILLGLVLLLVFSNFLIIRLESNRSYLLEEISALGHRLDTIQNHLNAPSSTELKSFSWSNNGKDTHT